ncbi:DUF2264 domain-containing protein [Rhodopirellula sp. SWK7]|uniref:DUF2264 domain-containing protein n=1 Tax=Rhodopirellula sp. SWK7 TaxID=595460 RepID=UPI001181A8B6|nr:DUF2264 domain-containing protein [Rhodopirellula sp. SWK7]
MMLKMEPSNYERSLAIAEKLLAPLVKRMKLGAASIPLEGPASDHGELADVLESFARPCLLASHWLAAKGGGGETEGFTRDEVANWFREGLVAGTDPSANEYWGPVTNYHQHCVEMGALVIALEIARDHLWTPLSDTDKHQVLRWMRTARGCGFHRNNHLFFGVLPLSFMVSEGAGSPGDQELLLRWMDTLESMYLKDGWFIDGMNETVDIYNAYAWHFYGLWWGKLYGDMDPDRAQRWRDYAVPFLKDYVHFFAASGENVPFGRSMVYRFNASAPFGLAHYCGVSAIDPGLSRAVFMKNVEFFVSRLPEDQPLSLGWTDEFPLMAEVYSCAGSPYWAAKAFSPLLIDPSDPFWTAPAQPLPSEGDDFVRPIPAAGMVVRSVDGDIELHNSESGINPGNTRFGTYKWGKTSYRTGVGLEVESASGEFPRDAALTAESEDGTVYGRHSTHMLKCTADESAMVYVLGHKVAHFSVQVETHVWWKGGWQLQLHRINALQPAKLTVGGHSLPVSTDAHENGAYSTKLQNVCGWETSDTVRHDGADRTHIMSECSEYPIMTCNVNGEATLICLAYCGKGTPGNWNTVSLDESGVVLKADDGSEWEVSFE